MTINGGDSIKSSEVKLFSDSMIALHDETEENDSISNNSISNKYCQKTNENKLNDSLNKDEDEWSNDFGWNQDPPHSEEAASASLMSLVGSVDCLLPLPHEEKIKIIHNAKSSIIINKNIISNCNSGQIGSEYDIKNIKIKKQEPDLIENFLNEMQPIIKTSSTLLNNENSFDAKNICGNINNFLIEKKTHDHSNSWECEEIIDIDE